MPTEVTSSYEFGKFSFDPANHLLICDGQAVALPPKSFEILLVLVRNGSRLTTKEELMSKVWPDSFVEEANLTVNVSALRKALGQTIDGQQYIKTVHKKGYRFVAPVKEIVEGHRAELGQGQREAYSTVAREGLAIPEAAGGSSVEQSTYEPKKVSGALGPSRWLSVAALVILCGAAIYLVSGSAPKLIPKKTHRLAVLPFQNLRESADTGFLGFSLADAVITKLGYVKELSVRPSYAVQKFKGQSTDIRKVAHELDADTLLTGTFLRDDDSLRIACQLIDANSNSILWKGTFDLKYDKLLTVQDQVAAQIINGLELTLTPSEAGRFKTDASITPLGYEYYLRGVDLYSRSDFPMAIKMLEKTTELAPNYALGWANLGKSYTANASFQLAGAPQYQKAQAAFERALALDADLIDARVYMANMFTDTGQVEKAVPLLRDALRTNPNHAEVHWELGYAYRFAGMLQESVAESELARRIDPGVKLYSSTLNGYLYLGDYQKFLESLPKSEDQPLIVFYRGLGEYYKKDPAAALKDFDAAFHLDHALFQAQIGKALSCGMRNQRSQGLLILRNVEAQINQRAVGDPEASYKIAQAYAVLGDSTSSLRVLKRSIDRGFFPYPYFAADPLLDSLRHRPEFAELMNTALARHASFAKAYF